MGKKTKIGLAAAAVAIGVAAVCISFFEVRRDDTAVALIGGADGPTSIFVAGKLTEEEQENGYRSVSMEEAQALFREDEDGMILDVRRADEFAAGHIPGAVNLPNEEIGDTEPEELPDKEQTIYVYCRSGNRSRQAAEKLASMGYTGIIECGGILDWTGEVEK